MAVVASATGAAITGGALAAGTVGAGLLGGAVLGAGAGALYSAVTKDGNILDSALTGALIGGTVGGIGAAAGPALMGEAAAGTVGSAGATPALTAAANPVYAGGSAFGGVGGASVPAAGYAPVTALESAASGSITPATVAPATASNLINTQMPGNFLTSDASSYGPGWGPKGYEGGPGMSGNEMLGYGLAGTAALSLLGGMNQPKLSTTTGTSPSYIRPYTYSQTKNPKYGEPGQSYYNQSYTAQPAYQAKNGGVIRMAAGGLPAIQTNMYPQSQQEHVNFATPTQMPASAEILASDYDTAVSPYTGEMARMADGGAVGPNAQQAQVVPTQVALPPTPVVGNQYTIQPKAPSQAVTDYNKLIATRANEEYVKSLPPANMMPGGKYGTADLTNQITQNYQDILGRAPDQAGLDYWLRQAQGGAKLSDIKNAFVNSQENTLQELPNLYQDLLGRAPDQAGLDFWTQSAQKGTSLADIQNAFKTSPEYLASHPNAAPVTSAVNTNIGAPSQADIDAYLAANPTTVRTYNAATKTYSAPTVTQAQIDAWKARTAPHEDLFAGMDPTVLQKMYADYERQQRDQYSGGGKEGGLMPNALRYANGGGIAGTYNLGSYSDGGRLLKGPGDGVSDDIPAVIGQNQPARLAEGEFVIPARIVSELGNGSTDAGAKRLYAMMDNIQAGRKKTIGKDNVAKDTKAKKHLLA